MLFRSCSVLVLDFLQSYTFHSYIVDVYIYLHQQRMCIVANAKKLKEQCLLSQLPIFTILKSKMLYAVSETLSRILT